MAECLSLTEHHPDLISVDSESDVRENGISLVTVGNLIQAVPQSWKPSQGRISLYHCRWICGVNPRADPSGTGFWDDLQTPGSISAL